MHCIMHWCVGNHLKSMWRKQAYIVVVIFMGQVYVSCNQASLPVHTLLSEKGLIHAMVVYRLWGITTRSLNIVEPPRQICVGILLSSTSEEKFSGLLLTPQ